MADSNRCLQQEEEERGFSVAYMPITSTPSRYFTKIPLIILAFVLAVGLYFALSMVSVDTILLRLSLNFFNIFTLIPISIIIFGGAVISFAIRERQIQRKSTTFALIDIGAVIVLIGMGLFIFYVID